MVVTRVGRQGWLLDMVTRGSSDCWSSKLAGDNHGEN